MPFIVVHCSIKYYDFDDDDDREGEVNSDVSTLDVVGRGGMYSFLPSDGTLFQR